MLNDRPDLAAAQSRVGKWVKDVTSQAFGRVEAVVEDEDGRIRLLSMFPREPDPRKIALEPVIDGHYIDPADNQSRYRPLSDQEMEQLRELGRKAEHPQPIVGRIEYRVSGGLSASGTRIDGERAAGELARQFSTLLSDAYDHVLEESDLGAAQVFELVAMQPHWPQPRHWTFSGGAVAWLPATVDAEVVLAGLCDYVVDLLESKDEPTRWLSYFGEIVSRPLAPEVLWRVAGGVPGVWTSDARTGVMPVGLYR